MRRVPSVPPKTIVSGRSLVDTTKRTPTQNPLFTEWYDKLMARSRNFFLLCKPASCVVMLFVYWLVLLVTIEMHIQSTFDRSTKYINVTDRERTHDGCASTSKFIWFQFLGYQSRCRIYKPRSLESPSQRENAANASAKVLVQQLHVSAAGVHLQCNCESAKPSYFCCQRAIINVHKMGVVVVQDIRKDYFSNTSGLPRYVSVETPELFKDHIYGSMFEREYRIPFTGDYRHVVVTRHWYDAIISGYLYHKSGRECWLDWYGRSNHTGWLWNNREEDWEKRILQNSFNKTIMATPLERPWWRPGKGRDLCRYLSDEPEEEGLRVYTAWTMISSLLPVLEFRRQRLQREQANGWNRTIFLCYEELVSPMHHISVLQHIMTWLFPTPMVVFNISNAQRDGYRGGHASNQDPDLRKRLHDILQRIDQEFYQGAIFAGSAEFGCPERYHRKS